MATEKTQQYLHFSFTQSGANAFVAEELLTGLLPANGYGMVVDFVEYDLDTADLDGAGEAVFGLEITKSAETGLLGLGDSDVLLAEGLKMFAVGTANASAAVQFPLRQDVDGELIVVSDVIHMGFDSTNLLSAANVVGRIGYRTVKMKEVDILRILQG